VTTPITVVAATTSPAARIRRADEGGRQMKIEISFDEVCPRCGAHWTGLRGERIDGAAGVAVVYECGCVFGASSRVESRRRYERLRRVRNVEMSGEVAT